MSPSEIRVGQNIGSQRMLEGVATTEESGEREPAGRRVVAIMAVASGAVVANIYYAQPLADTLATQFRASAGAVGF